MDYMIRFNCLILLFVLVSSINSLDSITDSDDLDDIINEEPENMVTFYRQDRSTLFPRVGRSDTKKMNRLRQILMNNPNFANDSPKRAVRIVRYGK
ncbi:unnamed protein product [Schistosoma rodhaini]|uniref:Uncharacterized protein n=2 Tax=Schistosoma TaxID=6181 RepID=A0A5K4FF27_SCHMA|nr:unnamed protein product [Schistosoma rodhaini]CAH8606095.1 unnamed protein product [Schistosoma rodhaini]